MLAFPLLWKYGPLDWCPKQEIGEILRLARGPEAPGRLPDLRREDVQQPFAPGGGEALPDEDEAASPVGVRPAARAGLHRLEDEARAVHGDRLARRFGDLHESLEPQQPVARVLDEGAQEQGERRARDRLVPDEGERIDAVRVPDGLRRHGRARLARAAAQGKGIRRGTFRFGPTGSSTGGPAGGLHPAEFGGNPIGIRG